MSIAFFILIKVYFQHGPTDEIKTINTVFTALKNRVRTYWLHGRKWTFADWKKYIKGNGLLYPLLEGMIWSDKSQDIDFILSDHQLLNVQDEIMQPADEDEIILWHPVLNSEERILMWQNYLWTRELIQPERQAFREHYPFSKTELDLFETPRFAHHFLEVKKLMAIANTMGWTFTYSHEGDSWPRIYIKPLDITAHFKFDYSRNDYAIPIKDLYFTKGNSKQINSSSKEKIMLAEVPLVTLSEICRDLDLFIATTSIGNSAELSENRQQFHTYRTEYQKGLFSDDATIKIRRQILQKIVPALKLNYNGFDGNYIIFQGKVELYRIHLGSGHLQSYETQRHVNLIPDMQSVKKSAKIRLPVEEDETLTVILGKMIYLQKD